MQAQETVQRLGLRLKMTASWMRSGPHRRELNLVKTVISIFSCLLFVLVLSCLLISSEEVLLSLLRFWRSNSWYRLKEYETGQEPQSVFKIWWLSEINNIFFKFEHQIEGSVPHLHYWNCQNHNNHGWYSPLYLPHSKGNLQCSMLISQFLAIETVRVIFN